MGRIMKTAACSFAMMVCVAYVGRPDHKVTLHAVFSNTTDGATSYLQKSEESSDVMKGAQRANATLLQSRLNRSSDMNVSTANSTLPVTGHGAHGRAGVTT